MGVDPRAQLGLLTEPTRHLIEGSELGGREPSGSAIMQRHQRRRSVIRDEFGAAVEVVVVVEVLGQVATVDFDPVCHPEVAVGPATVLPFVRVGDVVAVVVAVDAAVVVFELVEVLGLVGASVARVGDRVAVAVRRREGLRNRDVHHRSRRSRRSRRGRTRPVLRDM